MRRATCQTANVVTYSEPAIVLRVEKSPPQRKPANPPTLAELKRRQARLSSVALSRAEANATALLGRPRV